LMFSTSFRELGRAFSKLFSLTSVVSASLTK
jgi:hypothetical protein